MILDTIVAQKKTEVDRLLAIGIPVQEKPVGPPRGFRQHLLAGDRGIAVIAEAKKASPSKGVIRPDFDPAAIAASYQRGGARAISVLTDVRFFQGSLDYIPLVRQAVNLPVLRKDFIIHEMQVEEAAAFGADAILLIAAILEAGQLRDYQAVATALGIDVLVEIHDENDLEKTMAAGSNLIGINNRNLRDFTVDLATTFRLRRLIPAEIPVVSESGIRDRADIKQLEAGGIQAALVGETLMRAVDPEIALRQLLEEIIR